MIWAFGGSLGRMLFEEKVSRTVEQSPGWGLPREAPKEPWSLEQGNCWG